MNSSQKRCCTCHEEKALTEFSCSKTNKDGLSKRCKQCCREAYRIYKQQHKEVIIERRAAYKRSPQGKATSKRYREAHKDVCKERTKQWRKQHPEKVRAISKRWAETHSEQKLAATTKWRKEHSEQVKEQTKEWRANNPEKVKASKKRHNLKYNKSERAKKHRAEWSKRHPEIVNAKTHRRRAKKKGAKGTHTATEIAFLRELQDRTCLCCGRQEPEIKLEVDHILPIGMLGRNDLPNLQLLCRSCNARKGMNLKDYRSIALKNAIFSQQELF